MPYKTDPLWITAADTSNRDQRRPSAEETSAAWDEMTTPRPAMSTVQKPKASTPVRDDYGSNYQESNTLWENYRSTEKSMRKPRQHGKRDKRKGKRKQAKEENITCCVMM